jgi:hypothetical protein
MVRHQSLYAIDQHPILWISNILGPDLLNPGATKTFNTESSSDEQFVLGTAGQACGSSMGHKANQRLALHACLVLPSFTNCIRTDSCHQTQTLQSLLKPHCIRCSHFKVEDVSALEASSNRSVRIVESVTASATYAMTLVMAWMLWRRDMDLLVPAGTSTRLDWIQCGFNVTWIFQLRHYMNIH